MIQRTFTRLVAMGLLSVAGCGPAEAPEAIVYSLATRTQVGPWTSPNGRRLKTERYEIFTTVPRKKLDRLLPGFLESAHKHYHALTGLASRPAGKPLTVYMMADRQQWDALTRHRTGRSINITAGGYCLNGVCVFWDIGLLNSLSVAAHEALHQFFFFRLRDRLPMWLEEGLCVTAEGFDLRGGGVVFTPDENTSRFSDLRNALVHQHWWPLKKLLPSHSMEALGKGSDAKAIGYYGQLWALARMLRSVEPYRTGLRKMLRDAEAGRFHQALHLPPEALAELRRRPLIYNRHVAEKLFRHYISDDLDAFDRKFRAYAEKIAGLE